MQRALATCITCLTVFVFYPWLSVVADELTECDPEPTDMTINVGDIIKCAITPVGDSDLFRFNGKPGEVIRLTVADLNGSSFSAPVVTVFDPDNNVVASLSPQNTGTSTQLLLTELTYLVLVTEAGNNATNTYSLSLQLIFKG